MNRLPDPSTATPVGVHKLALVAGPPSPVKPSNLPPPATVVMTPAAASTRRIRLLPLSAMNRLPDPSAATPAGLHTPALVAAPPSPLNPHVPLPATVVMTPVAASTRRIRLLLLSAM